MSFKDSYAKISSRYLLSTATKEVARAKPFEKLGGLSDEALRQFFRSQGGDSTPKGATLYRALAAFKEACRRTLNVTPYDTQVLGVLCLLKGQLAEMKTGEGKTLTVAGAAALAALGGKRVDVMTANAYLAKRDAEMMTPLLKSLGLSVGHIHEGMSKDEKRAAYAQDVVYGVSHEFGFDYLKDNLRAPGEAPVNLTGFHWALIDEIDSVLLDDARTPMIISKEDGSSSGMASLAEEVSRVLFEVLDPSLHLEINLKERTASLNTTGYLVAEQGFVRAGLLAHPSELYSKENGALLNALNNAVTVRALYRENRDFVVRDGQVLLVDAGTGRPMADRRMSDGLHEALEAFANVAVGVTTKIQASMTYQSFFGLYENLAGLTGTAATEADEFAELYGLQVVVVPPNRPSAREDLDDLFFSTKSAKFEAIVEAVKKIHPQPLLVGTGSVRDAEKLAALIAEEGLTPALLTARHVSAEAEVIARAGEPGSITVATNMAGRGTDILLGGEKPINGSQDEENHWLGQKELALSLGGLFVIGAERNWTRRVDNQLAGRAGRQGEPGSTQFYVSLEDETLAALASSKALKKLADSWLGQDGVKSKTISAFVTAGQKKFEEAAFAERRDLLQYDSATSAQRKKVYALRENLLTNSVEEALSHLAKDAFYRWGEGLQSIELSRPEEVLPKKKEFEALFGIELPLLKWTLTEELSLEEVMARAEKQLSERIAAISTDEPQKVRQKLVSRLDAFWAEHLTFLDSLKSAVRLRAKIGVNPIFEFQKEAFSGFSQMLEAFTDSASASCLAQPQEEVERQAEAAEEKFRKAAQSRFITRNEACPCGSGLAYKHCHGKLKQRPSKVLSAYSAGISSKHA
jgi:preprotein translocase subunit SecA